MMPNSKKKILVVEDDKDISQLLRLFLKENGFSVSGASDGLEGFYKAKRESPNLMILDLNLPRLSGEEVCKAIREDRDKEFASLPIVMLTAKSRESDQIVGRMLGANAYFTKPFEAEVLLSEIKRLLRCGPEEFRKEKGGL